MEMQTHFGKWQEVSLKLNTGQTYNGIYIWLDPDKRTSDMLNNKLSFLSVVWEDKFYCINKREILWVNEPKSILND